MKTLHDIRVLHNIPVFLRTSLNAPIKNGKVESTFRLKSALPTIEFLQKAGAKIILGSHVSGKGTETLLPVYEVMQKMIPHSAWSPVATGEKARALARALLPGEVLMLENLRRDAREENNELSFAKELAELADVFIQDSFDVCHRAHASVVSLPKLLPAYAGLTVIEEVKQLTRALAPAHPAFAIIAGAKFSTKEPVIRTLLSSYDTVMVGGALASDLLSARGYEVGASLVSSTDHLKEIAHHKKIMVPSDVIVSKNTSSRESKNVSSISVSKDEVIVDIGNESMKRAIKEVERAKTILWNGPLGWYEKGYDQATRALARAVFESSARIYIGGGDTIDVIEDMGLQNKNAFLSTGGGAMLEFLAKGTLPGLRVLS